MRHLSLPFQGMDRTHTGAGDGEGSDPAQILDGMMHKFADDLARRRRGFDFLFLCIGISIGLLLFCLIYDTFAQPTDCPCTHQCASPDEADAGQDERESESRWEKWDLEEAIEGVTYRSIHCVPAPLPIVYQEEDEQGSKVGLLVEISESEKV